MNAIHLSCVESIYSSEGVITSQTFHSLFMSAITRFNVSSSSDITEHPTVVGDVVADHIIRKPSSISLSGTISSAGSQHFIYYQNENFRNLTFAKVEELFKKIKNEGLFCTIHRLSTNSKIQFSTYNNFVLTNFQIEERINSINIDLTFNEVLVADVVPVEPITIEDNSLPLITDMRSGSFTSELLDYSLVSEFIDQYALSQNMVTEELLNVAGSLGSAEAWNNLSSIATTAAVGAGIATLAATSFAISSSATAMSLAAAAGTTGVVAAGSSAVPVAGWVVAGVLLVVTVVLAGVAIGMQAVSNQLKEKAWRESQFYYVEGDENALHEAGETYNDFKSEIFRDLQTLNDAILVYRPTSNTDFQTCYLNIDNDNYKFIFEKSNANNAINLSVYRYDSESRENKNWTCLKSNYDVKSLNSFAECTSHNYLFTSRYSGHRVYAIHPFSKENVAVGELEGLDMDVSLSTILVIDNDLKPEEFTQLIQERIKSAFSIGG